jgi:hypothetical protein
MTWSQSESWHYRYSSIFLDFSMWYLCPKEGTTLYPDFFFHSYPVVYVGCIELKNSLRLVDFEIRNEIVREAIALVREAAKARAPIYGKVCTHVCVCVCFKSFRNFFYYSVLCTCRCEHICFVVCSLCMIFFLLVLQMVSGFSFRLLKFAKLILATTTPWSRWEVCS